MTAIHAARTHHQTGNFAAAETIYRSTLAVAPDHAEGLFLMGMLLIQTGRAEEATEHLRRVVTIAPQHAKAHNALGAALLATAPAAALEIEKGEGGPVCRAKNARQAVQCGTVFMLSVKGISPEVTDRVAIDAGEANDLEQDMTILRRAIEAAQDANKGNNRAP